MKCPGQDSRFWKEDAIFEVKCPHCGSFVEFFRDDSWRICKNCSKKIQNPRMDFGCATHCPYAEQCLGELSPELLAKKQELLTERLAKAIKQYLKENLDGIGAESYKGQEVDIAKTILQDQGMPPDLIQHIHDCISNNKDPKDWNSKILSGVIKKALS